MRRVHVIYGLIFASTAALGACDDALNYPPEAAISLSLDEEQGCKVVKADALPDDGELARLSGGSTPEEIKALPRAVDGSEEREVSCLVRENAASDFTINATVKGDRRIFSISGGVAGGMGTGLRVSWLSPDLGSTMSSSSCTAIVDEQRAKGGGAIRISYTCPNFLDPTQPGSTCEASGSVILERCDE